MVDLELDGPAVVRVLVNHQVALNYAIVMGTAANGPELCSVIWLVDVQDKASTPRAMLRIGEKTLDEVVPSQKVVFQIVLLETIRLTALH